MPPSRSKGRERPSSPSRQEACANRSFGSSERPSSLESSPARRNGEFTLRRRPEAAFGMRGGYGSKMTSTPKDSSTRTRPYQRSGFEGGFVSRVNSSFAELLRRIVRGGGSAPGGDATFGDIVGVPGHAKSHGPQPEPKALMSLRDQEVEVSEEEMHLALHPSRVEAERKSRGKEWPPSCMEKEEDGRSLSWTVGTTTRHVSGSTTHTPPPPPPQNPIPDLPTSSRTRNPTALPLHLSGRLEAAKRALPRSLVPCMLVS